MSSTAIRHIDEGNARAEVTRWISPFRAKELAGITRVHQRMRSTKWSSITLVNLHPWALHATGYIHHDLRIAPAPFPNDEAAPKLETLQGRHLSYSLYAFLDYKIDGLPNEAGDRTFEEVLPLVQALDYIYQHNNSMRNTVGGLFCYEGTKAPQQSLDAVAYMPTQNAYQVGVVPEMTVRDAIEQAHAAQLTYYLAELDKAEDIHADEAKSWRKGQRRSEIPPNTRKIVQCLRAWGIINTDPDWFTARRTSKDARPPRECPSCGFEAKPKATRCINGTCTYVFEPFEAFATYSISLRSLGADLAFRRLNGDQVGQLLKDGVFTETDLEASGFPIPEPSEKKRGGRPKANSTPPAE